MRPTLFSLPQRLPGAALTALLLVAGPVAAQDRLGWDKPSYGEMAADGFVVRPISFVSTVLGTGAWIVTLPFSALGGNAGEAAQELIVRPARFTFTRPLGDF
jgi:hypothetical protein